MLLLPLCWSRADGLTIGTGAADTVLQCRMWPQEENDPRERFNNRCVVPPPGIPDRIWLRPSQIDNNYHITFDGPEGQYNALRVRRRATSRLWIYVNQPCYSREQLVDALQHRADSYARLEFNAPTYRFDGFAYITWGNDYGTIHGPTQIAWGGSYVLTMPVTPRLPYARVEFQTSETVKSWNRVSGYVPVASGTYPWCANYYVEPEDPDDANPNSYTEREDPIIKGYAHSLAVAGL